MSVNEVSLHHINFEVYINGSRSIGAYASVDLPEIEYVTTEVSGAGIMGKYESPVFGQTENLQATLHCRVLTKEAAALMQQKRSVMLSCYGVNQGYDAATGELKLIPVRVVMRGLPQALHVGKFEPAEQMETEVIMTLDYIKLDIDGSTQYEVDKFNYIYNVDGVDLLGDFKVELGIEG